nr:hypothetical protein [Tanacetum cinerariifolium]
KGYRLPPSYYAIKKTFKMIGLGTSRWKDNNKIGKKVPKKVLHYFLIIHRLQLLYKSSHTTKELTWHATGKCTESGKMQHPIDGRAWKNFDTRQSYGMWSVILTTYNRPLWLCMKESSLMLTLLIPVPKSQGKDIDVSLRYLIDDLKDLWVLKGVETIDVATGQMFNMRVMLLWTINDFLARSSLSGWIGQGYMACPTCNEDIPFVRVLRKTAYVGLKKPHKLKRLSMREKGKHPSYGDVKIKRNVLVELNWTKRYIFYKLEYWSFLTLKHNLDVMHIGKNVLESFLNTFLTNEKSKDTTKARQDLKNLLFEFIKGVKLLDGFESKFKHKVTDSDSNITGLESHDCHMMMQRLLSYELHQYLHTDVAIPIIKLCSFFKQIDFQTLMEAEMVKAQSQLVNIMCNLEQIYPPAFYDVMIHLVIHLPQKGLEGAPIPNRWMYPFEKYMKKLKNYV